MRERAYGLIVDRRDYSETSAIVTFFTPQMGLLRTLAKGAKRPKNSFQSALELFAVGEFLFIPKANLSLLTEFHLDESFLGLRRSLVHYLTGCYFLEVLRRAVPEGQRASSYYQQVLFLLDWMEQDGEPLFPLLLFQLASLDFLGVFPNIKVCIVCGKSPQKQQNLTFSLSQGGYLCSLCQKQGPPLRRGDMVQVPQRVFSTLESLRSMRPQHYRRISLDGNLLGRSISFCHACLSHTLERPLHSWSYLVERVPSLSGLWESVSSPSF